MINLGDVFFIQALDTCKKQEELIENMVGPLEQLRESANAVFAKVNIS